MKNDIWHRVISLLIYVLPLTVYADLVPVFEQNFDDWDPPYSDGQFGNTYDNWSLSSCSKVSNSLWNCLKISGSATTPELGEEGDLLLTFQYAKATASYVNLTVSVVGGGSITESVFPLSPTSNTSYTSAELHITNATSASKIVFSTEGKGALIDNVVVYAERDNITAPPIFSLAEGYYKTPQTLAMNCATEGATIYYTTDGTAPTDQSTQYTGEISIGATQTVKAIAYKGETASEVASAYYYVGDFLYADAFTANEHGDSTVASNFVLSNLNIGRSAILTFRAKGTAASSTLNVRALENNEGTPICDKTIDLTKDVWLSDTIALPTLKEGSTMTIYFNNGSFAIDDILLVTPPTITLSESANNTETLQNNRGKIVDVATVRTLRGGIWNTLCLPFAVSRSVLYTGIGGSQNCYITTYDHFADNIMTFRTADGAEVIPAGTPFLVKIDNTVTNPVFRAVTITVTAPLFIADGGVTFQGCFNPTSLEYNGTDLFIGTDNFLYVPAEATRTLGGLRAFVHRANSQTRLSLAFDDETTAIRQADILPAEAEALYTLQGQRVVCPGRGLYIKDGKKIFIK